MRRRSYHKRNEQDDVGLEGEGILSASRAVNRPHPRDDTRIVLPSVALLLPPLLSDD